MGLAGRLAGRRQEPPRLRGAEAAYRFAAQLARVRRPGVSALDRPAKPEGHGPPPLRQPAGPRPRAHQVADRGGDHGPADGGAVVAAVEVQRPALAEQPARHLRPSNSCDPYSTHLRDDRVRHFCVLAKNNGVLVLWIAINEFPSPIFSPAVLPKSQAGWLNKASSADR